MKYLGIPLKPTKWNSHDCACVMDKIRHIISCWGTRHLFCWSSPIGIVCLVWDSGLLDEHICLPQSVIKEINKLCRRYLWGDKEGSHKLHAISWERVCLPKMYRGLGLKEGSKCDTASLGKYLWAILMKKDSLWLKWVNNIYIKLNDFWDESFVINGSWYWRELIHLRSILKPDLLSNCTINGRFSVSTCYAMLVTTGPIFPMFKQVWCSLALPKHHMVFWLATQSKQLTRDQLTYRMNIQDLNCSVCEIAPVTHSHLFFECSFSQVLRHKISTWVGDSFPVSDYNQWLIWIQNSNCIKFNNVVMTAVLQAMLYTIWINRNSYIFS